MAEIRAVVLSLLFGSIFLIILSLVISDTGSRYANSTSNNSADVSHFAFYGVANQTMGLSEDMQGNLTHLPSSPTDAFGSMMSMSYNTVAMSLNAVLLVRVLISDFLSAVGMQLGLPTGADATLSNGGLLIPMIFSLIMGVIAVVMLFELASMVFRYRV